MGAMFNCDTHGMNVLPFHANKIIDQWIVLLQSRICDLTGSALVINQVSVNGISAFRLKAAYKI